MKLPVSDITITPGPAGGSRIRAFVSLRWAGIQLRGLKIVEGERGLFLSTPAERSNAKWYHFYSFEDRAQWEALQAKVLAQYGQHGVVQMAV